MEVLPQTRRSGPLLTLRRADATDDGGYTFQEQWFVDAKWTSPNMQVAHEVQERRHVLRMHPGYQQPYLSAWLAQNIRNSCENSLIIAIQLHTLPYRVCFRVC